MKKFFIVILFSAVSWGGGLAYSFSSISELQREIDKYHLKWKAGSSSVWTLSSEEKRHLLGWSKEYVDENFKEAHRVELQSPTITPPSSFDWRNVDGYNWMTPVKNQGNCGSCWAFAIVGAFEANIKITFFVPDEDIDLSEQDLVSCACNGCEGGGINCAYSHLRFDGIPDEECDPYQASDIPCGTGLCPDYEMRVRKISSALSIPYNRELIKDYIMQGPLYVSMTVYYSFYGYSSGVYEPLPGESPRGGHAVVMLGWDDEDSSWICKNSWGTGWGMEGYFKIRWGTCGIESDAWRLVPQESDYPMITVTSYSVHETVGDGDSVLNPGETAEIVFSLRNKGSWAYASNVHLSVSSDSPYLDILSDEADFPDIPPGSIAEDSSNPIVVEVSSTAPPEGIPIHLDITANGDGTPPYERQIDYTLDVSYSQYGWPFHTQYAVFSSPLLVPDQSGDLKLFFGAGNYIHKVTISGTEEPGFPFDAGSPLNNSQCAGNINGDGKLEIVVLPQHAPLYILNLDGTIANQIDFSGHAKSTPALQDLDNDGKLEIVFGTLDGLLYAVNFDGSPVSDSFPIHLGRNAPVLGGIAIGDINGDHKKEIIVPTLTKGIFAFTPQGTLITGWPFLPEGAVRSSPVIGNLNGEGDRVIFGTADGYLYFLNPDGTQEKKIDLGHAIEASPVLSDIDGDGSPEIIVGTTDGYIFVLSSNGEPWGGNWPIHIEGAIKSDPCVSDFNDNGKAEIVITTSDGVVHLFDIEGNEIQPFPLSTFHPENCSPSIFDLDMDGNLEILVGNSYGLYALDVKSQAGEGNYWSMYGATPERTHNFDDINVNVNERSGRIIGWKVEKPYPNPSWSEVTLDYSLPISAPVKLDIFDITGRRVKTLINNTIQKRGTHSVEWNLTDIKGRAVSNGVYFYRFKSKNYIYTGKILIVR